MHQRIHALKQQQLAEFGRSQNIDLTPERDAIRLVARDIASEATLLAFDEFQVTDIADALIMTQLFGELWRQVHEFDPPLPYSCTESTLQPLRRPPSPPNNDQAPDSQLII